MSLVSLTEVLKYQNPAVLKLYVQNYPNNKLNAETAFKETLKYLWLCKKHEADRLHYPDDKTLPPRCVMLRSMREIDEMWHEFILFTRDYSQFCNTYFGEYCHHLPNIFDNMPVSPEAEQEEIAKLLPYIYDHLGDETMRVWFADYITV
jgi:hypothetical protein